MKDYIMNKAIYIPTAVDQILVPHMSFQNAKQRIETQLLAAQNYLEPTCIAVVGESRTGKSRLLECITKEYPKQRTNEGLVIPVLSIKTPAKPSVKALVEILLQEIGDPLWYKRGSENEKTEQLYKLLKQTKTHTLIIDEFQHFYDKVSHKVQHYLSDWLKIFVDRSGLMLIVAGLPDCMAVINQNQQLRGRFLAPIRMPRFDWNNIDSLNEFIACLESFQKGLDRYDLPDLTSEEMAFRFYCATGGLIGYLAKILHQVCLNAQVGNKLSITLEDIAKAYEESVWVDELTPIMNPFWSEFETEPSAYYLKAAQQIGTASPEPVKPRASRLKPKDGMTAAEALTR
jgi:hypothetical protein